MARVIAIANSMKKIAEVLLRRLLWRYPLPTRINLFSYFGQYAWLKDVLEELRPELFPQLDSPEVVVAEPASPLADASVLGILERSEISGRFGYYQAKSYLGQRGNGHLFSAIETTSKHPVVIKEFLLPTAHFTKTEALQRQSGFHQLSGIQLADGRLQEFRVIQPLEAIADTGPQKRCYLVTHDRDRAPTLRQHLKHSGALPQSLVQEILSQLLQSLDFLHKQKFRLPSGAMPNGLIHGNLSLDSVLWTEQQSHPFVYLCDLLLWEQWFDASKKPWETPQKASEKQRQSTEAIAENVKRDLKAVSDIGITLLQGLEVDLSELNHPIEPPLRQFLDSLQMGKYSSAEAARRDLLQLMARSPATLAPLDGSAAQAPPVSRRLSPLLALSLLGLVVGLFMLLPRLRSTESRATPVMQVSTCCLKEVSAIPAGEYRYTSVKAGTWWTVVHQPHLLKPNQSLPQALQIAQPNLRLGYKPTAPLEQVLSQVQSGEMDFAVLPLVGDLPSDLVAQEIAYDGLAAVVSFSYSKREEGLPSALNGRLNLSQVQQLYEGKVKDWKRFAGLDLPVQLYVSENPEAIAIFEQRVLQSSPLPTLSSVTKQPSIKLMHEVIRDFEASAKNKIGGIGVIPLSEIWGQCSIYPLALSQTGQSAVQPLAFNNGQNISPETDLCNLKGAYQPVSKRFQSGQYPLSYAIGVVYPRDNRRSTIAKKFIELMRTVEGQRLLQAAGLVPLSQNLAQQKAVLPSTKQ
jgi:hypothetical protein